MNRWMTRICAAGLLGGMSMFLGSCAHNDDMLVVIGAMAATPPDCKFSPSASATLMMSGTVDVGFGAKYTAVLLVANQLASRGSKARLRGETSNVNINNAEVRLLAGGTLDIGYFSVPASGYIPVGSGEDSGYGAIAIDVLPGSVVIPDNTGYIIAEIRVQGTTLGGTDIESNLFRFQIFVVDSSKAGGGGLVYYPVLDSTNNCVCGTSSAVVTSCFPGQDAYIACCNCSLGFCKRQPQP